jgi:hypothetical protein
MNYQKVYNQIIQKSKLEARVKGGDIYYEAHHIIPKCLGGQGKAHQWRTHSNLTLLTAKEHRVAHACLHLINPHNQKLALAYVKMFYGNGYQNRSGKVDSKLYTAARELASIAASLKRKGKTYEEIMGEDSAKYRKMCQSKSLTGRKHTSESKERMRKPKPKGFGLKVSAALKGRIFSEETLHKHQNRRKPISQFSLDGVLVKRWPSASVIQQTLGISSGNLPKVCREGRILAGYRWSYSK